MKYGYVLVVRAQFTIKKCYLPFTCTYFYLFWGRISIDIEINHGVKYTWLVHNSVADPGFYLRGRGRGLCQRGVRKSSESVVGWNKSHFERVLAIFLLKLCLTLLRKKIRKISVLGIKKS